MSRMVRGKMPKASFLEVLQVVVLAGIVLALPALSYDPSLASGHTIGYGEVEVGLKCFTHVFSYDKLGSDTVGGVEG